jgi:hypothetical protein
LNILIIGMYPADPNSVFSGTERVVYNLSHALSIIPGVSVSLLKPYRFRHFSKKSSLLQSENFRVYQIAYATLPDFFRISMPVRVLDTSFHEIDLYRTWANSS